VKSLRRETITEPGPATGAPGRIFWPKTRGISRGGLHPAHHFIAQRGWFLPARWGPRQDRRGPGRAFEPGVSESKAVDTGRVGLETLLRSDMAKAANVRGSEAVEVGLPRACGRSTARDRRAHDSTAAPPRPMWG